MLYQNISAVLKLGSYPSRVLFLTQGSDVAVIKCRNAGAFLTDKELHLQLPFAYTGTTTAIWLISDIHVGFSGDDSEKNNMIAAITDIDTNVGVDHVFAIGDLIQ